MAEVVDLAGLRVLELGAGEGRLTFDYAHAAASVLAVEPNGESVDEALRRMPPELEAKVRFEVAAAEEIEVAPSSFDLAFFSWSL